MAAIALVIAGGAAVGTVWRLTRTSETGALTKVGPEGEPRNWSVVARKVTSLPGRVHCFSMVDAGTARVVWGAPKRAHDIDVSAGTMRAAPLLPETFSVDCPQARGGMLLFTATSPAGGNEIRLSRAADGSGATTATPGFEPLWFPSGEEFLYNIDPSHVAMFSLATVGLELLGDPGVGSKPTILDKAISYDGKKVALLVGVNTAELAIAVFEGSGFQQKHTFGVPAGSTIQFGDSGDDLFVSYWRSQAESTLMAVDWRAGRARNVGRYEGLDLSRFSIAGDRAIVLGRHMSSDAWLYGDAAPLRLTSDGATFSAARSDKGALLLGRRNADGTLGIWWGGADGSSRRLTYGTSDVEPAFAPDGETWAYADYAAQCIRICSVKTGQCKVLRSDDQLPSWPRFSPDGKEVAYITQVTPSRLMVVSLQTSQTRQLGTAYQQCPPVWSGADRIWTLGGSPGRNHSIERDASTGKPTGAQMRSHEPTARSATRAAGRRTSAASPFSRGVRTRMEERSELLHVPVAELN